MTKIITKNAMSHRNFLMSAPTVELVRLAIGGFGSERKFSNPRCAVFPLSASELPSTSRTFDFEDALAVGGKHPDPIFCSGIKDFQRCSETRIDEVSTAMVISALLRDLRVSAVDSKG